MSKKIFGKTIKLFLIDGFPQGRISAELSNWTGKAYKIPRNLIKSSSDREDLQNTGIYLLLGKSNKELDKSTVYIGEADGVYKRLVQHLAKDNWTEAIIFISKDENLNKAHIKYLENRLHKLAAEAQRFELTNSTIPTKPSISESDQAEIEEFLENIILLINTLGYKIFDRLVEPKHKTQNIFLLKRNSGVNAKAIQTNEGFVVLKGSKMAPTRGLSLTGSQEELIEYFFEKNIVDKNSYEFQEDYLFSSPSAAATILLQRSANGLSEWKLKNGRTLKEFESKK